MSQHLEDRALHGDFPESKNSENHEAKVADRRICHQLFKVWLHERYKLPIYITENGMSCLDWVGLDGGVHDPQRIDFTRRYLRELRRAMDDGVDVQGYFHWSLMDNFEWADGYRQRFGLVHVDYQTQKRTIKDSGYWYARNIASNGKDLDELLGELPGVEVTTHVGRARTAAGRSR